MDIVKIGINCQNKNNKKQTRNCLLSPVSCLLSPVSCLLSTVYCLLSTVYCLLPPVSTYDFLELDEFWLSSTPLSPPSGEHDGLHFTLGWKTQFRGHFTALKPFQSTRGPDWVQGGDSYGFVCHPNLPLTGRREAFPKTSIFNMDIVRMWPKPTPSPSIFPDYVYSLETLLLFRGETRLPGNHWDVFELPCLIGTRFKIKLLFEEGFP